MGSTNWTSYYDQPSWASDYPYGAETAFSLPLEDALYLVSRGPFQHGQANIEQSPKAADTVYVRVQVAYYGDEAFERATVCQMERTDKEHGVGIFVCDHCLILPSLYQSNSLDPSDSVSSASSASLASPPSPHAGRSPQI